MTSSKFTFGALSCILMLSTLQATSLSKIIDKVSRASVNIDSSQAHNFLTHSRARRNADPRWYRMDPNFQAYYRYYSSIGHPEGLYEVDRIRILYQQMRHLEHTYGRDASKYQNALGVWLPKTTQPPPRTPTKPPASPLSRANVTYLCNPKDPLCKPRIVYLPSGAVPVACDPRYNSQCELKAAKVTLPPSAAPTELDTSVHPLTQMPSLDPPASSIINCDRYRDPGCLIEAPPRPVTGRVSWPVLNRFDVKRVAGEIEDEAGPGQPEDKGTLQPPHTYYDPYDYRRDLYDPYLYANLAQDSTTGRA